MPQRAAWRLLLAAICLRVPGAREAADWTVWQQAADFTSMDVAGGAGLCDPASLRASHCPQDVWRLLLLELCRHCMHGQCVSDSVLSGLVFEVLHMYASMVVQHGEAVLNDFGCKHGLLAALVFHSEHVGFEFRPPQARVELVRSAPGISFQVAPEDHDRLDAAMDERFWSAGLSPMLVDPKRLTITDKQGVQLVFRAGNPGVERYPLSVRYSTPAERSEFVNLRRRFLNDAGHLLMNINFPVASLAPYPLHTGKLRAMRQVFQAEYDDFLADVSSAFAGSGIFHAVMFGDSTASYLSHHYGYLNTSRFLHQNYGVRAEDGLPDTDPSHDDEALERSSIFVPLELRSKVTALLFGGKAGPAGLGTRFRALEMGLGHVQLGEQAYEFARGLNFRVFCERCLWISVYFYVSEDAPLLPAAFWLPCRLPMPDVFPLRHEPLGSRGVSVPRQRVPPAPGHGLLEGVGSSRGPEIHRDRGSCREALRRTLATAGPLPAPQPVRGSLVAPPALPPVLPELLPMHDISDVIDGGTNLDMLMAIKQIHSAPGLEMYNDKIGLSQEFRRRGLPTPDLFFSSYDPDFDVRPKLRELEALGIDYVAKASHMCCSQAVFVMENGVDIISGEPRSAQEIQDGLMEAYLNPFREITPKCGDWGTVKAGETPGVIVERLMKPSIPVAPLLEKYGGGRWVQPDIVACHMVWSTLLHCVWELKLRDSQDREHTEELGMIFRDGSCASCRYPVPFLGDWPGTVALLEQLLPGADYLRITLFVKDGRPVINEIEYTSGGLDVVPVRIAREWTLKWLEGYHQHLA